MRPTTKQTLFASTSTTHGANSVLYAKPPFGARHDFVSVAHIAGVPAFAEQRYKSVDLETWVDLFAPAGTGRDVVDKLAQAFEGTLRDKSVVELLRQQGAEPQFMGPEAFARYVESEIARWGSVVRAAGIKLE